jgi:hypothetical protein
MPGAADACTVINAMHHADPQLVTFLFHAFPQGSDCRARHSVYRPAK